MSSAPTSRWVTARTVRSSSAPMITPWTASCVHSARASLTRKTTMLVATSLRVDLDPRDLRQPAGQRLRVVVVHREPLDVVVERPQRAGRDDARLAQRAAEHLLVAPRLVDDLARAGEHGAHRRAEALGEVDPGGVEARGPLGGRDAATRRRRSSAARRPCAAAARWPSRPRRPRAAGRAARRGRRRGSWSARPTRAASAGGSGRRAGAWRRPASRRRTSRAHLRAGTARARDRGGAVGFGLDRAPTGTRRSRRGGARSTARRRAAAPRGTRWRRGGR